MRIKLIFIALLVVLITISLIFLVINRTSQAPSGRRSQTPLPTFTPEEVKQAEQTQGEAGFTPGEAREFNNMRKEADDAYSQRKERLPFIVQLPFQTDNFKVQIMATSDTVTITTYGSTQKENLLFRQQALDWLKSNGANFENFTIAYSPANP